ncbi:MAG TPA: hypothetical protein VNZ53_16730 [Steroidobacteraceae bacterium]|jgi:hypothetical protein|nr:hypothetical protein [Steroidobacteraceae bacterium]
MSDLHTHFRQHHHRRDEDDDNKQNIAKDRQERAQPRPPSRLFGVWQTRIGAVSELAIDRRFYGVPQEIGAEQDDNGAQHTMDDPGQPRVLRGEVNDVDTPPPGEHRGRADDQERPDAALEDDGDDAWRPLGDLLRTPNRHTP